jgi:single-strand DNA-binding protein
MNSCEVFLIGKVGRDPTIKEVGANHTKIAEFSLATSKPPKERGGEWKSTWHSIKAFGKTAERVAAEIRKGDTVAIMGGELDYQQWEKDGVKHNKTDIIVAPFNGFVVQIKSDPVNQEQRTADQDMNQSADGGEY